jgi:hypothetical protein
MALRPAHQRAALLRPHIAGWRIGWALNPIGLSLALLLAACSGSPSPHPPLPDLHLPGVTKIPGLAAVHAGRSEGHVINLTTYQGAATGAPETRVLFVVDGALYTVGLDGRGLQPIPLDVSCGYVSATEDGRWAACQGQGFGGTFEVISLTGSPPAVVQRIALDDTRSTAEAALSPDGHSVAAVSTLEGGCAIAVYAAASTMDAFSLRAVLSLPQFFTPGPPAVCWVSALSWSPDAAWLAFAAATGAQPDVDAFYVLPVAALLPSGKLSGAPPITLVVPPNILTRLGPAIPSDEPPAWSRVAGALAVTYVYGHSIVQMNLATHEQAKLLTVPPSGTLSAVAWAAGSRQLVFAVEVTTCDDCLPALGPYFALYVYTPVA